MTKAIIRDKPLIIYEAFQDSAHLEECHHWTAAATARCHSCRSGTPPKSPLFEVPGLRRTQGAHASVQCAEQIQVLEHHKHSFKKKSGQRDLRECGFIVVYCGSSWFEYGSKIRVRPTGSRATWQAALFRLVQGHLQDIFIRHQKPGIWCLTSATEQSVSDGFI